MSPNEAAALTTNRLTHTLKVAQVSRAIAEALLADKSKAAQISALGGLDADVVEAAGLAHDLGHPPFGHIGEVVLDKFARKELGLQEGFEGNAQSFRITARLEPRAYEFEGIDATAATLAAVLKYPWLRRQAAVSQVPPKFGYYEDETAAFELARAWLPEGYPTDAQSLEAAVMDVADDITYALHDLEDFRSVGVLSPMRIPRELRQWRDVHGPALRMGRPVEDSGNFLGRVRKQISGDPRYKPADFLAAVDSVIGHLEALAEPHTELWRLAQSNSRIFISSQITAYLENLVVNSAPSRDSPPLRLCVPDWLQVTILKQFTRYYVIARPDVAAVQRGQQAQLHQLLHQLRDWLGDDQDSRRAPVELREMDEELGPRALLDYVSGLGDHQALTLLRLLNGQGPQTGVNTLTL